MKHNQFYSLSCVSLCGFIISRKHKVVEAVLAANTLKDLVNRNYIYSQVAWFGLHLSQQKFTGVNLLI